MQVSSLGIQASVVRLEVSAQGNMPDPEPANVGLYDFSVASRSLNLNLGGTPGLGGNVVLAGRHSTPQGPAAFFALYGAQVGQVVEITYQGRPYRYSVTAVQDVPASSSEWTNIVTATTGETVTLITDKPNNFRLVVKGQRIN